eukprot:scaffold7317_cov114-Cylindrotheca_fusiformis.AAC.5
MPSQRSKKKPSQTERRSETTTDSVSRLTPLGTTRNKKASSRGQKKAKANEASVPPCRFFAIHGRCRFGNSCHFSHGVGNEQKAICRFFLQGNCRYGDACRLRHSSVSAPSQQQEIYTCGICLEQPKEYGLLSGCNHTFCFSCLMKWRVSAGKELSCDSQHARACP